MKYIIKSFLTVCFTVFVVPLFASSLKYAIIIDAGSTGSRAHVFAYTKALLMVPVPVIKDIFNQSTKPGLSSYAPSGIGAGASLKPILDASVNELQAQGVDPAQVPISVFGTAGMRLLPEVEQKAIYTNVRTYIRANYRFPVQDNNVKTITGVMEGVYDWLDVNYLQNNFIYPPQTNGAIDMGGASTQIAFATTDTSQPDNEIEITINHTTYRIFSQSFLGLGLNEAIKSMHASSNPASCYPEGYNFGSGTGLFDLSPCLSVYASIINDYKVAEHLVPATDVHFVAFSGVYSVFSFFDTVSTPSQSALETQINAVCYLSWTTLQSMYSDNPFLSTNCANGVYLDDLLYNMYQLQASQLTVATVLNGTGIDWTLGALLYSIV